jgi:iron(III) transport system ATP-binding protein
MVFQTYAIWPHMNVFDNVAYPLQTRKAPKDEIRRKVQKTLKFVQLEGFENRPATKLSGGQQQRVALARALVPEPKVILFDEPLSNLDAKLREETRKELRSFLTRLKITAVYVTHDRIEALSLSDTIAVMRNGRIAEIGTPKDIYFDTRKKFVADFIGRANLIEGKVTSHSDTHTIVDSKLGTIACKKRTDVTEGAAVTICIRPEFIQVTTESTGENLNTCIGNLASMVFIGDSYEGEIKIGDTSLVIQIEPTVGLKEGDEAYVSFEPQHCTVLIQ